ncbi:MAG: ABC transporter ATP-binding protein [Firmicutes bacterium]|nr:ABC transporter ATP-binding protein [Bacillota bacterium]
MTILKASGLTKVYGSSRRAETRALDGFSFEVEKGRFVGIMGPSGSGKTTLLNVLATIDAPTSGTVLVDGLDTSRLKGEELALFRRKRLGFVFQDYNLLDSLSIEENIALPLVLDRRPLTAIKRRVEEVAAWLGIEELLNRFPYEVSGGQQQRAAIARAIVHEPVLVFADEPTGNLDSRSARAVMDAFTLINARAGATILMVTHDPFAASFCQTVFFIRDGRLYTEIHRGDGRQAFFQQILDVLSQMGGAYDEHVADRV